MMRLRRYVGTAVVCSVAAAGTLEAQRDSRASGGPIIREQAAYDVGFYELALRVSPEDSSIAGSLTVHADVVQPIDHLVLDLDPRLAVHGVTLADGGSLPFERRGGRLWISFPRRFAEGERLVAAVAYGGQPRAVPKGGFDGFIWEHTASGDPWISVSCELFGADLWWPTKDHPSDEPDSMAIRLTVPEPLTAASNGRLRSVTANDDGTRTFDWFVSTPINNYGVSLNIANYVEITTRYESVGGETIPVTFWAIPEHEEQARAALPEFVDHLRHLEEVAGPYPFRADKYGIAEVPYLGMEHQSVIAYGANFENDAMGGMDWGFDALHQHELAHEWYGNQVTPANFADLWLNESFATYAQSLYAESRLGEEETHTLLRAFRQRVANRQPIAARAALTTREAYTGDIYFKGALVLHTLRYLIGDEAFFEILRQWTDRDPAVQGETGSCRCRLVTTDDFVALASQVSGTDLSWFFEVYVRRAALPRLVTQRRGGAVGFSWDVPDDLPFPMPVPVVLGGAPRRIDMIEGGATVQVESDARLVIDPEAWVLMERGQ
jgi:aminopeptidase N